MKAGAFWRSDRFAGGALLLLFAVLQWTTDFTGPLERRLYDFASTFTASQPSDRIAIIAMDDQSIASLGPLPWPREVHARLIDQLAAAQAKTVVHTALILGAPLSPGPDFLHKIKDALDSAGDAGPDAANARASALVEEAQSLMDTDAVLAHSLQKAGNVLLPSAPTWAEPLAQAAAGIGPLTPYPDVDGVVRAEQLLVGGGSRAVPSLALLAALSSLNLQSRDFQLQPGESVQLGKLHLTTDAAGRLLPQFYPARGGKPAFALDSFADVLSGKIAAAKYAGKIVIVGATGAGAGVTFAVPGHAALTTPEALAHVTSSILKGHFFVQPAWGVWASLAAFLLVAAYGLAGLPRLSAGHAAASTVLLLLALLVTEFGLLAVAAIWIKLVFPATALVLVYLSLGSKRPALHGSALAKSDGETAETHRMMGLALQGQGQLDMAFERLRRAPMGEALLGDLYGLALEFEGKRQFDKAEAVYQHIAGFDPDYKDVLSRLARAKNVSESPKPGAETAKPGGDLLPAVGAVDQPMLGRYLVEKELGKGAMGVVYLGRDPKIGRVVAIKTLALSQEFAGEDLADARARFFREAETAGRLQHQNIVTIFDAGEEHDLAFIAMEFLKGRDLSDHCQRDQLLPPATVVRIAERVASALAYAHQHHVVHRDIKPANIMFDAATDSVKVTDFGIARIADASKTRTGLVLGTPSFMSPEQLAGKKVDGRTDLYSLGVMLYQLLTGVLPFRGDSMSALMFKIANEEAADIRSIRPELSESLANVVALALSKRPETRYQTGDQFAADLRALAPPVAGGADIEI
ncbi:serine/threonine protein kinase [Rhodoferax lacus]|uniref:non-specific serine/threonine protein kinase n=1 Tax=Rhodoferax lacus TaxID=2184758 RepID=A0A3E1RBB2_9BURK|nr:serine/threonine-protein kinase [Rhodoferax lacus]RFO96543.1 serine/threonine protein kinase [Rhodoferax lacus]